MSIQERAITAAKLDSIEADGQYVIFHTSVLNAAFLATISEPLYSVIDVDADTDPKSCPIATGPFMVKGFEVDTFIEMERYDGYWNGPSQIDSVTLKCIADDSTRALAIQSGEIDLMQRIGANDVATFKDNPNYTIFNTLGARTRIMVLNFGNEFLADINVRRALAASINYDALVMILGDTVGVAGAPYPSSSPYGYDTLDVQHYDPEAAAQYLADAGFADSDGDGYMDKDGSKLTLKINYANANYTVMLEAVQAMVKASGIDLQLNLVDSIMEMTQGQVGFDIVVTNWQVLSTGDPQWFLESQYRTGAANNGGHYSNAELDAIADKLAQTTDVAEREAVTIEAEKILLSDVASIYLVGETNFVLSSNKVGNVTPYPIDYYFLDAGITIE
jgi:peptide/nickel transport system substrate-binding protein